MVSGWLLLLGESQSLSRPNPLSHQRHGEVVAVAIGRAHENIVPQERLQAGVALGRVEAGTGKQPPAASLGGPLSGPQVAL